MVVIIFHEHFLLYRGASLKIYKSLFGYFKSEKEQI